MIKPTRIKKSESENLYLAGLAELGEEARLDPSLFNKISLHSFLKIWKRGKNITNMYAYVQSSNNHLS